MPPERNPYFAAKPGVVATCRSSFTMSASIPAETAISNPFAAHAAKSAVAKASLTAPEGSTTVTEAHSSPAGTVVGKTMWRNSSSPTLHLRKYSPEEEIETFDNSSVAKTHPSSKGDATATLWNVSVALPQMTKTSPQKFNIASEYPDPTKKSAVFCARNPFPTAQKSSFIQGSRITSLPSARTFSKSVRGGEAGISGTKFPLSKSSEYPRSATFRKGLK